MIGGMKIERKTYRQSLAYCKHDGPWWGRNIAYECLSKPG
jgi:hypothetical protein